MVTNYYLSRRGPAVLCICLICLAACAPKADEGHPVTSEGAQAFMDEVESHLLELSVADAQASWVNQNFITDDTEALASKATENSISTSVAYAKQAARFDGVAMSDELARKFKLLKLSSVMPTPADPKLASELTQTATRMNGTYGKGKYRPEGKDKDLSLGDLSDILAKSRKPDELLMAWKGWRKVSPAMRKDYERFVELANQGSRELGYANLGEVWCSLYDMPAEDFPKELDRLWEQVKPLYLSLHAYVRLKLREQYGADLVPEKGPIPAHLLGNMWSQSWINIYDLVAPADADPGYDLTEILKERGLDELKMVHYGEDFFTSMGFDPLPTTFWERSLFTKPADRDVVCHASAWDIDQVNDVRIKMCIKINEEDFATIHHELGHNFYQRAYSHQPFLFRNSANDGFHEAVGDTLALSITPKYLVDLGFLDKEPDTSKDIGLLLKLALEKVAFLPFGLLIDQWRWKVFSGEITPDNYNKAWWELRQKYQGIIAPVERTEADFDPGSKYHIPANTPYSRYFLAAILQFQFHRALAAETGYEGPLNRASIYGSKEAGKKLDNMLKMGVSQPWPQALYALTGSESMDAGAIVDYFAPLQAWLDAQLEGKAEKGW